MDILERSAELDFLHFRFQDATQSRGSLVFVSGEMGIGKTTLVDLLISRIARDARLIKASFEGLSIPEPLGPFRDAVPDLSPDLHQALAPDAPGARFFAALLDDIRNSPRPVVLVAEDVHWADEASLDLLRFLGRRVGDLRLLVIATLRDDELSPDHPLRRVLGDLASVPGVYRMALTTLSVGAVAELARDSDLDPAELHEYTGGNPFFVSEIVASGSRVPMLLQDAILGRASRLDPRDRSVLDAAATLGALVDIDILQRVTGANVDPAVDQGLAVGLLRPTAHGISFRHAAVQSILLNAISAARRQTLHKRILACLQDHPIFRNDIARLAFHAEEANDPAAFGYALEAAEVATRLQSHREAAEQYARALRSSHDLEPPARARLLEAQAYSFYLTTRFEDAISAQEEAATTWRQLGHNLEYGNNLRRLARFCFFNSRHEDAMRLSERAHTVLTDYPDSREYTLACGYLAEWRMRANAIDEAFELGNKAMTVATRLGDDHAIAHALITLGAVRYGNGDESGIGDLQKGLELSRQLGNEEFVLRALTHLAEPPGFRRPGAGSRARYIAEGIAYAREHNLDTKIVLFGGMRVRLLLDGAHWSAAIADAETLIDSPSARGHYLLELRLALGLARLRSGEPASEIFDQAAILAAQLGRGYTASVDAALAEAAWLKGDDARASTLARSAIDVALSSGDVGTASALALWAHRAGQPECQLPWLVQHHALEMAGDWQAAARMWQEDDIPLEALRARSASTDERDLRAAHAELERMGAHPDALRVARRMRALGFGNIPRGPRRSTRTTYAALTTREVEILSLLSAGASNREIARRLFLSLRTVEHHVSAILGKLGVSNRQQAVICARDTGVIPK